MTIQNIKYLVFSGGGIRGIGYAKIPLILQEQNILTELKGVAGTSAGSIISGLIALKFPPQQIYDIVTTMDYNKFKDDSYGIILDLYRLGTKYGWNKGDYFQEWYDKLLEDHTNIKNITLKQAYELSGIELTVISTCWDTSSPTYFNYKNHPDLPVSVAIRMSMSYPFFFVPHEYEGKLFVDGGMTNNYPIELFPHEEVLGFKLLSDSQKMEEGRLTSANLPRSLISFTTNLISIMLTTVENSNVSTDYWNKTVFIDTGDISSMNFDITTEQQNWLIENGEKSLLKYLNDN